MITAAARTGAPLGLAAKFRFTADINAVAKIMAAGDLGTIRLVDNAFTSRVDMSKRWNADPALSGGGVIIDNGTHSVDLIRMLLGPLAEILAVETSRPDRFRSRRHGASCCSYRSRD